MTAAMTDSERALWIQAQDDFTHALAIAIKAWGPAAPEASVIQASAATVLIHVSKLRSEERIHVRVPQSPAPAAVKRDGNAHAAPSQAPVAVPPCPQCGGQMWDNRTSKKKATMPDFVCRDKECKDKDGKFVTGVWLKDLAKKANGRPNPLVGQTAPPSFEDLPDALSDRDELPF